MVQCNRAEIEVLKCIYRSLVWPIMAQEAGDFTLLSWEFARLIGIEFLRFRPSSRRKCATAGWVRWPFPMGGLPVSLCILCVLLSGVEEGEQKVTWCSITLFGLDMCWRLLLSLRAWATVVDWTWVCGIFRLDPGSWMIQSYNTK